MKKKRFRFGLLILLLGFAFWRYSDLKKKRGRIQQAPSPSLNTNFVLSKNSKTAEKPTGRKQLRPSKPTLSSLLPLKEPARQILPSNPSRSDSIRTKDRPSKNEAVSFRSYKGMAIAYGDIVLGTLQDKVSEGFTQIPKIHYWPSRVIPYHIQPSIVNPERVLKALAYLSEKTVLEFVPYEEGAPDAVVFEPIDENCFSYVGRITGTQPIYISPQCDWTAIVHEILHAVGLLHEHSRPDRDRFIEVRWDSIPDRFHSQFDLLPDVLVEEWLKYEYDVRSIMHYGSQILDSKIKGPSIIKKNGHLIPEPNALSGLDIQKVNDLFQDR